MYVPMCVHIYMHVGVCISMCMIVDMCMSINMHMSSFIIKLIDILIIYFISTYFVHGFVFKTYSPQSTF